MGTLKYTRIKTGQQYDEYCKTVEMLVFEDEVKYKDEIELLELLIEKWDEDHNTLYEPDPVELIKSLLISNRLKGLSKETIRKLAKHFKLRQEAFNRPYQLHPTKKKNLRNASLHLTGDTII